MNISPDTLKYLMSLSLDELEHLASMQDAFTNKFNQYIQYLILMSRSNT